jgi:hypothetical protein
MCVPSEDVLADRIPITARQSGLVNIHNWIAACVLVRIPALADLRIHLEVPASPRSAPIIIDIDRLIEKRLILDVSKDTYYRHGSA